MTLAIALVVLAPFVVVGISLAENANELLDQGKRLIDAGPPDPPSWVGRFLSSARGAGLLVEHCAQ